MAFLCILEIKTAKCCKNKIEKIGWKNFKNQLLAELWRVLRRLFKIKALIECVAALIQ